MTASLLRPPWRNRTDRAPGKAPMTLRRRVAFTCCALLVLAGCGYGAQSLVSYLISTHATCMNRGATVVMHEGAAGECVGITDGSYPFVPHNAALAEVLTKIKAMDSWVTTHHAGDYVSVAYLLPISTTGGGVEPITTVIEQLAGAYAAQYYANMTQNAAPYIQLLVASSGTQAAGWPTAVQDIKNDVTSQHLVAVAGIGVSLNSTIAEVTQLAAHDDIPVFGASVTSDAFSNIKNMVRVVPSNAADVRAILDYIRPRTHTAILAEDLNRTDSYDATLINEFESGFPDRSHHLNGDILTYDTTGETSPGDQVAIANAGKIEQMPQSICASGTSYVLFAGRGRDLATLLTALGNRNCTRPITVVTGDDVTDMPVTKSVETALAKGVMLEYAGEANPDQWDNGSGPVVSQGRLGFSRFQQAFKGKFSGISDADGDVMIGFDAVLASIDTAHDVRSTVTPGAVAIELNAVQGTAYVPGASGPINLSADYLGRGAEGSNPMNKAIPILSVTPNGAFAFEKLEFSGG
jgi:hypothetical protein